MTARVLLVEDDLVTARREIRVLERAGYEVVHAATVGDADQALCDHDFDLAILDIFLPDGDGFAICQRIRAVVDLPVMMLSGLEDEYGQALVGTDLGPQSFMTKPFEDGDLLDRVKLLLGQDG